MKKEVERLQEQYKEILRDEIYFEMEKSDPLDNRSPRMYRVVAFIKDGDLICEVGYCRNKENIIKNFEEKLQNEVNKRQVVKVEEETKMLEIRFFKDGCLNSKMVEKENLVEGINEIAKQGYQIVCVIEREEEQEEKIKKVELKLNKKIQVNENTYLSVGLCDGKYYLTMYQYNKFVYVSELCNVKKLNTLNKYAKEFGVEFYIGE